MKTFDIAIVGGGPAGFAASIFAALQGLQVILLESSKDQKHQPGESLLPGSEILFKQLGINEEILQGGFLRNPGFYTLNEFKQMQFQSYSQNLQEIWLDYQIPRNLLNTILQKRAEGLGVSYWRNMHITNINLLQNRIRSIQAKNVTIQAHYYLDATGSTRLFARQCKIPYLRFSIPLVAKYGYLNHNCPFQATLPIYIQTKESAIWYTRIAPQKYAWVLMHAKNKKIACQHKSQGGALVSWEYAKQLVGENYGLIGDAAGRLDPSSGKGVLRALLSGMMAAHTITQKLQGAIDEFSAFQEYQRWFHALLQQEMSVLKHLHFTKNQQ